MLLSKKTCLCVNLRTQSYNESARLPILCQTLDKYYTTGAEQHNILQSCHSFFIFSSAFQFKGVEEAFPLLLMFGLE